MLWRYPFEASVMQPLKLTVTGLAREEIGPRALPPLGKRPLFMTEEGPRAAEYGTLTHNALMSLDLSALRGLAGARRSARRSPPSWPRSGRRAGSTATWSRICSSAFLRAARAGGFWPLPGSSGSGPSTWAGCAAAKTPAGAGVIDCCFLRTDGEWVLLDYKTDRADDPDALADRYRPQIGWYANALETITGIPVRQRLICLLRAGLEIAV